MERNDEGIAYFCERVERCRDDVDLLLLYGSYLTGDAGPRSDVDLCFVPATERGWQVAETFIYQRVGYDLFGRHGLVARRVDHPAHRVVDARLAHPLRPHARGAGATA